jgi:hypothetical protein
MFRRRLWVLAAAAIVSAVAGAEDRVLFDFEDGTFSGWRVDGLPAFGSRPVRPDDEMQSQHDAKARYRFRGWEGRYLVSQDILLSQRRGIRETAVPSGRLISEAFTIDRDHLRFRLGGLLHPGVHAALVLESSPAPRQEGERWIPARIAYANNTFDLVERSWDLREWRGQQARIHLVINAGNRVIFRADHFVLSDTPARPDTLYERTHWLDTPVLAPGKFHLLFDATRHAAAFTQPTLLRGHDGAWHLFAEEAKNANGYFGEHHALVYHARSDDLRHGWSDFAPVLCRDTAGGESWVRYPVVAYDDASRRYHLLYWGSGGVGVPQGVHRATSVDGRRWERPSAQPVFQESFAPLLGCILRHEGEWVLVYSNHGDEAVPVDRVALFRRRSRDLVAWGKAEEFSVRSARGQTVGYSRPQLFRNGDEWFLLTTNRVSQQGRTRFLFTHVFSGPSPFSWDLDEQYRGNLDVFSGPQAFEEAPGSWALLYGHVTSGGPWVSRLRFAPGPRPVMLPDWPGIPVAERP